MGTQRHRQPSLWNKVISTSSILPIVYMGSCLIGILTVLDSIHFPVAVHNGKVIISLAHLACGARVRHRGQSGSDMLLDLLICLHARAGVVLIADGQVCRQGWGPPRLAQALEHSDRDFEVRLCCEAVGIDQRVIDHSRGYDGYVPSRRGDH